MQTLTNFGEHIRNNKIYHVFIETFEEYYHKNKKIDLRNKIIGQ